MVDGSHQQSRRLVAALFFLAFLALSLIGSRPAWSQQRTSPVTPRRPSASSYSPRFSPYLGLLRGDGGPLPNYFQFVKPQTDLLATLRAQDRAIQRERQRIGAVGRRLDTLQRQGGAAPTGIRAGFMSYSHFFPTLR